MAGKSTGDRRKPRKGGKPTAPAKPTRVGVIPDYALWPQGGLCDTTIFYKRIGQTMA